MIIKKIPLLLCISVFIERSNTEQIAGQARDEGNMCRQNNPATPLGFTILPNTTGVPPPPMFCRPYRANHKSTFYITGVHTPAYVLSPLQG